MSLGKESIKRAADAGAKVETAADAKEVKAEEAAKTEEIKAAEKPAAKEQKAPEKAEKAAGKSRPRRKAAAEKAAPARKTSGRKKAVKTSVLTPVNADEMQEKFVSPQIGEDPGIVSITEELPVYLL